ncbi:MAG TPA: glucoamylase family protein, partial [Candidatus Acidoferrales bacterium]|nr:glucoamylase family protein [Candidatus Acidoferrales bacterium]
AALRFFSNSSQSDSPDSTGYKGFYYHFLEIQTGKRVWQCELSLIDTALLLAGMLTAAAYFTANTQSENEIRQLAEALYLRVDWQWALNGKPTLSQGWKPECGFLHYGWEGYSEASILYVLAIASPTRPIPANSFSAWTGTYQWENLYGHDFLYAGPLFMHQFSHAWIDFRRIQDAFMRQKRSDYFENSRQAVHIQREYALRNPHGFRGYGENFWGLSAGDGPSTQPVKIDGRNRRFFGYTARGVPYGPDDGTIAPPAALASVAFAPEIALAAIRHFIDRYPEIVNEYRLPSGFNPTLVENGSRGWISEGYLGLDQGIVVLMIENYRSGLIWKLMRQCPYIGKGLRDADFRGGWL